MDAIVEKQSVSMLNGSYIHIISIADMPSDRGSADGIISDDSGVYTVAIISITAQGRWEGFTTMDTT